MRFDEPTLLVVGALLALGIASTAVARQSDYANRDDVKIACVIVAEAAGEGPEGWRAVGSVVQNRAQKLGCSAVRAASLPAQFKRISLSTALRRVSATQWSQILDIAGAVTRNQLRDNTGGALYFYSGPVPWWAPHQTLTVVIGGHTFLR